MRLLDFKSNTFSQCGQDGVVAKAFEILGINSGYCVEFGAWDGSYLSNSRRWLQMPQFGGCLMEAHGGRFNQLQKLYQDKDNVQALNKIVAINGLDSLDAILSSVNAPIDFDLLSIDIDCDDYHIWESLVKFRPKLVLIETNPYIPFYIEYVQRPNLGRYPIGASVVSMFKLGLAKGYRPIAYIGHDWLFVRDDLFNAFNLDVTGCIPLFLDGTEIQDNQLMAHGQILDLPTGPASTESLNVRDFINQALSNKFGHELAKHYNVLTSPKDFMGLF